MKSIQIYSPYTIMQIVQEIYVYHWRDATVVLLSLILEVGLFNGYFQTCHVT